MRGLFQRLVVAALVIANRYEAGKTWRTEGESYLPEYAPSDARYSLPPATRLEIVRKSRYWEKNSGLANRLSDLFEQFVAGPTGLVWNPASDDEQWNQAVKTWLEGWYPFCDVASRQDWSVLQSLIARTWFFDGECFILKTRGEADPSKNKPAYPRIQLIETHRVGTPPDMSDREGKDIVDGIEVDKKSGRPIAYYIADTFAGDVYRRVESIHVIHVFEPSRPGQMRGIPMLYPVLNKLHSLDDLQVLEMKAARAAAEVTNVYNTQSGEEPKSPRDVQARFNISTQKGDGTSVTQERVKAVRQSLGGRTVSIKLGEKLEQFEPKRPTAATNGYWDRLETEICAGVGIPRSLVYAASIQGTVLRGDFDIAAGFFQSRSQVLITAFKDVYIYVVGEGSRIERTIADKPATWVKVTTRAPRAVNVDIGRNLAAQVKALAAGLETLDSLLGPRGLDWREWVRQKIVEAKFIQEQSKTQGVDPRLVAEYMAQGLGEMAQQPNPKEPELEQAA